MSDLTIGRHAVATPIDGDTDPQETAEWLDSLASLLASAGPERVCQIMDALAQRARDPCIGWQPAARWARLTSTRSPRAS